METLSYEIIINAPKQRVWDVLWGENTYSEWTQFFGSGSQMKTDWKVGGKTYFVNHEGAGMVSTIDNIEEPDQIIFKHLGMIDKDGIEDTESMEVKQWSGCFEKYILIDYDGQTKLHAEVQTEKDWEEHMNTGFTKGLEVVKNLAEAI
ncbi:SRPBCC domain-containing protein [Chryseobacterium wangxinyae]|uniref:SRPBCC family protein n=1 Tax=Chryseobacterium sp. CY350 TaxID=2997336 RepID=UPI0022713155|nr:SRPBCC domain-containing protein [Chryseobacterium sp. CY350]MCY0976529.1 SRPBCC domain-containing protein [Chryseobacterium sp. CY350]WBZ96532.1 SRPBCC domain-containing protein [Chryseobacterium sp. CY350]